MQAKLTKRVIDSTQSGWIWDTELKGFGVRIWSPENKVYVLEYRPNGGGRGSQKRRLTIGRHNSPWTPDKARTEAKRLVGMIVDGNDPMTDRQATRAAMTVTDLCDSYLKAMERGHILGRRGTPKKAQTISSDKGRISRHIKPLLGSRKVRDLTTGDINRFMRDVADGKTAANIKTGFRGRAIVKGGKVTAARTIGLLGGILTFAVSEGITDVNPARGVRRPADRRRQVAISESQYRQLGDALKAANEIEAWQIVPIIRLLALTGCRRGEIEGLSWSEVDLDGHCLRLSDSKTGASIRPIGAPAVAILKELTRHGEFVFTSTLKPKTPFRGLPKVWRRLINDSGLLNLTPHGLRHGFAGTAAELGFSGLAIAALLGHSAAGVTERYVKHIDGVLIATANRVAEHIDHAMGFVEQGV